ncbi:hypothetical protein CP973_00185 [Streptomyces albofaciens JCM 4342]|uniref:hypothetical protein n=1 Tax=Streptomyces albofaciens TaxID=66866 RepID=UPI00123AA0CB|nr:hypothetical protein [Streptomyces albofaciens]KAA6215122.1 hypothetical protein CP973_39770 [Streptomyces albofaciens JCM 4342]KAA6220621.1 hypothetical protein CP973_00185 [Streptomyces albofaciens JCM 4342]
MTAEQQTAEQPVASLRDLALEEAALDLLAARVAAAKKNVRTRMQRALDDAATRDGVERIAATLPGGEQVATISLRKGETGPVVTDEEALARWLRQTWPDQEWTETRIVRTVKPWRLAELIAEMQAAGAARIADRTTGEVHDVPGVVIKPTRARTHALTWRTGGKDATAEAWRTGALARQFAAITAGGGQ